MTPEESAILFRIEAKLDTMSEKLTTVVTKEEALAKVVEKQQIDLDTLKAAYYKVMGILAFLTVPGVGSALWLGIQIYSKKP